MQPFVPTIPQDLMKRLSDATERFRTARQQLERSMDALEYRHHQRAEQFRQAERELEQIDTEISQVWQWQ